MNSENLKIIMLQIYSKWFKKLAIHSITNTDIQKEHLIACNIFLKVIDYYEEAERRGVLDRIELTALHYENTIFNIKKALQAANTNYYE